jgi:DNA ligase-1
MKLEEMVRVSAAVAGTPARLEKISRLAGLLSRLAPDEIPIAVGFLTGWPRQGKLRVGWATVSSARDRAPAATASLELRDVDTTFGALSAVRGKSSGAERARILDDLFSRATAEEQSFLANLMVGEVRQGALEGVLLEAIARAGDLPPDRVRRAAMMAGDLGIVARAALGARQRSPGISCSSFGPCSRCSPIRRRPSPKRWPPGFRPPSNGSSMARESRCIARAIASPSTPAASTM